ncbi:PREDICTED: uncharacterized protein LOC109587180 [Amphimedon queenslandica]|nr:PREDICTED: uncharacterized protein LOC109587180 [Amphimedon queenslandica]|eukprot:XP_019858976.1 PREDICTED: uncharacterized protein LOC109587180 [Amphimedon queenslandica]
MLLLLSGDVELNPGPMVDDQPTSDLFVEYLAPLADCELFAFHLPGIIQQDIDEIKTNLISYFKMKALHDKWIKVYSKASWREVITALKECEENELAKSIELKVADPTGRGFYVVIPSSNNPISSNLDAIVRTHSAKLAGAITTNLYRVTDALYAEGLITMDTKENIQTVTGISDYRKSSQLVSMIQQHLACSLNPPQYITKICIELINQKCDPLKDIATKIVDELVQDDSVNRIGSVSCTLAKEELKPGDHIHAHISSFHTHHGIYIGEPNCDVIYCSRDDKESKSSGQIQKTTLDKFRDKNRLCLVAYNCSTASKISSLIHSSSCHTEKAMPLPETRKLAIHFLNHPKEWGGYDFGSEPSEVFACFCKTGLMNIAAQYQISRWIPSSSSQEEPPDTYKEALEKYRKIKRQLVIH